jgi:hypothetical protein
VKVGDARTRETNGPRCPAESSPMPEAVATRPGWRT